MDNDCPPRESYLGESQDLNFMKECQEVFQLHDIDGDGYVSVKQFVDMARSVGQVWTMNDIQELMLECRYFKILEINFEMFCAFLQRNLHKVISKERLQECYSIFDRRKKLEVLMDDLKHFMTTVGDKMTKEDFEKLVDMCGFWDVKGLTEEQFLKMVKEPFDVTSL